MRPGTDAYLVAVIALAVAAWAARTAWLLQQRLSGSGIVLQPRQHQA